MDLSPIRIVTSKEYILKLDPEDNEILLELGRSNIIKDENECINYAVKMLIDKHMYDGESMADFLKDRNEMLKLLNNAERKNNNETC